ncbi:trypsin-3-like [Anticarsia gemmatalis]|uniref:trypsin-3-like n=1 Tax=Anticarsia gemmatalis TaxID=129554 RepID=UPI003F76F157
MLLTLNYHFLVCILVGSVASFDVTRLNAEINHEALSNEDGQDTIVGGHEVSIEQYPHQVYFPKMFCGGFIVSKDYVITAAHCTDGYEPKDLRFIVGSTVRGQGTVIQAAEVINHPNFNLDYDVAIVKAAQPLVFSKSVQPVKLPPRGRPMKEGSIVSVSGWGDVEEEGSASIILRAVHVPVTNFNKCKAAYHELTKNMWCAGLEKGGKDACQGDSGGAAVQDGMAVGIVSFGRGCARPNIPGVYANVASPSIRDFITKQHRIGSKINTAIVLCVFLNINKLHL